LYEQVVAIHVAHANYAAVEVPDTDDVIAIDNGEATLAIGTDSFAVDIDGADMVAAAAFVVGMHGAYPIDPCPILAARFNPGAVASPTMLLGLGELHLARLCLASAARAGGHGVAFLATTRFGRLGLASAALNLGGLFAAATLGLGFAATFGLFGMGLVAAALAAWSGGRRD